MQSIFQEFERIFEQKIGKFLDERVGIIVLFWIWRFLRPVTLQDVSPEAFFERCNKLIAAGERHGDGVNDARDELHLILAGKMR